MFDVAFGPMLIPVMVAIAFAAVVFALLFPFLSGEREKDKRIQGVTENRTNRINNATQAQAASSRKKSVADTLKELETRNKGKEKVTISLLLLRAGLKISPRDFYVASAISGVLGFALVYLGMGAPLIGGFVGAFIFAAGLPRWFVGKLVKRRQAKFLKELANSIDVVVRGVKSGLPLNECLQVVARESPDPVGSEFREVVEQQRLGVTIPEALDRLCDRVPLPEVRFLSIVIAIQQQAGGNLSEALNNLSGVLRDRLRMQLKIKALSAEAKASAMVLASLPPGVMTMVYITTPDYLSPLFTTTVGRFMVAGGLTWMFMGVMIMRKMINFKF